MVAAGDYPLAGWVPNPFFLGNQKKELGVGKSRVLMVSRLDGPDEKIVRRIIDDALAAEKQGLSGTAYFDARWPEPAAAPKSGCEFYDVSIHRTARCVAASGRMPVKLDSTERLFQPVPEMFFTLLVEGYLTLSECYAASTPWLSWRMVLVGDPLYRPFANANSAAQ